jgi:MFS family permease
MGLAALAAGLILISLTPRVPLPGYSQDALTEELTGNENFRTLENPTTQNLAIELPPDDNNGWHGLVWILAAMVPIAVGGGVLQPSINSLITKRVELVDVGGMLGISAAFLSGANAVAPLIGGAIFQAFGSTAPFFVGGLLMAALLLLSTRELKPGSEEEVPPGLARSTGGH